MPTPRGLGLGRPEEATPHLLVMLFAREGKLEAWERKVTGRGWARAFAPLTRLSTFDIGPIEPFGFADGISQPQIDWNCELALDGRAQLEFGNVLALGEVLLGYRNEYGQLTERPLLDPAFDAAAESLPPALDARHRRDSGRNGSYLVFRQLEQDVPGFWRFVDEQAGHDEQRRRALADAMVGRRRDGTPLIPPTSKLIAGIASDRREHETNGFLYDDDPDGIRCPFGAHIRRANPRTARPARRRPAALAAPPAHAGLQAPGFRDDMVSATRFHRLVRRGRTYGSVLSPEAALAATAEAAEPRGLHFICLGANISRQFEFVQNAWMMNAKFDGLSDESDPLLGNREPLFGGGRPTGSACRAPTARRSGSRACRGSSPCAAAPTSSCRASVPCATSRSRGHDGASGRSRAAARSTAALQAGLHVERRLEPFFRRPLNRLAREPSAAVLQWLLNLRRPTRA